MARLLVIGDLHCPADKDEYYEFCRSIQKKYKTDSTLFIGDIVDMESISFHDKNPELPEAVEEYKQAKKRVKKWYSGFKKAKVVIGNHDLRAHRKAFKSGIPSFYLLNFNELYDTEEWEWSHSFVIDDVFYTHGDGWGSQYPAFNAAKAGLQSTVSGHAHSKAAINWVRGPNNNYIFGMNVGSGVDQSHPALSYSKPHKDKAIHSCGVVIDGKQAYLEIMR